MTIDQATLGRRLKDAREAAHRTQEEVASALSVPRTAIAQIEAGNRSVSSLELLKLAKLYYREFSQFLSEEASGAEDDPSVVLHRIAPGLEENPEIERQVRQCLEICKEGSVLESLLGHPPRVGPPAYPLPSPRTAGEAIVQGAQVARQERARLGLGDAPIADMADLINAQGIWATGVRLPDHMSGLFFNHRLTGLVILVNFGHATTRKRFSYAHEYAHALLDGGRGGTVTTQENASELVEKRANAFAAAFLMPRGGVQQFLQNLSKGLPSRVDQAVFDVATEGRIDAQLRTEPGSQAVGYQDVVRIADWFKVSYKAAVYRLRSLNTISQSECDALLQREEAANDFRKMVALWEELEQGALRSPTRDRELVTQVAHLAIEAYRRGEISRGRLLELAETLSVNGRQLLELAQAAKAE